MPPLLPWDEWQRVVAQPDPDDPAVTLDAWLARVAVRVAVAVSVALVGWCAWMPTDGADVDALRRQETAFVVRSVHERQRAESLAALGGRDAARFAVAAARVRALRDSLARVTTGEAVPVPDAPPPRVVATWRLADGSLWVLPDVPGGWGAFSADDGTVPVPRVVVTHLRAQDEALSWADSAIGAARLAIGRQALAIDGYRRAYEAQVSARVLADSQVVAVRRQGRRAWWRGATVGVVVGAVAGLLLTR